MRPPPIVMLDVEGDSDEEGEVYFLMEVDRAPRVVVVKDEAVPAPVEEEDEVVPAPVVEDEAVHAPVVEAKDEVVPVVVKVEDTAETSQMCQNGPATSGESDDEAVVTVS